MFVRLIRPRPAPGRRPPHPDLGPAPVLLADAGVRRAIRLARTADARWPVGSGARGRVRRVGHLPRARAVRGPPPPALVTADVLHDRLQDDLAGIRRVSAVASRRVVGDAQRRNGQLISRAAAAGGGGAVGVCVEDVLRVATAHDRGTPDVSEYRPVERSSMGIASLNPSYGSANIAQRGNRDTRCHRIIFPHPHRSRPRCNAVPEGCSRGADVALERKRAGVPDDVDAGGAGDPVRARKLTCSRHGRVTLSMVSRTIHRDPPRPPRPALSESPCAAAALPGS